MTSGCQKGETNHMHSFCIVYEDILITDQTRDLWGSLFRHVHFHHTTSCYFTIDCVHKKVRGTREYFAMDYPLQLEKFTSTQLADIIVEAACILKARSAPQANDSSPTNKIPQGDPCRQEAGQGCFFKPTKIIPVRGTKHRGNPAPRGPWHQRGTQQQRGTQHQQGTQHHRRARHQGPTPEWVPNSLE